MMATTTAKALKITKYVKVSCISSDVSNAGKGPTTTVLLINFTSSQGKIIYMILQSCHGILTHLCPAEAESFIKLLDSVVVRMHTAGSICARWHLSEVETSKLLR